jgi:hypothetical protein
MASYVLNPLISERDTALLIVIRTDRSHTRQLHDGYVADIDPSSRAGDVDPRDLRQ